MVIVDQKERYRHQAALCYEIAATMTGSQATSMMRLGDAYAALSQAPSPPIVPTIEESADPRCMGCGAKMHLSCSVPPTRMLPAMRAFRCESCGETLILKGVATGTVQIPEEAWTPTLLTDGDQRITRYVAVSFQRAGEGFAPGPAVECLNAGSAIQQAESMARHEDIAGALAFSRRSDPESGEVVATIILKTFGAIPEGFDIG
jgi:DNA-directed RNA polymerase subunit RPC12/RpoP